MAQYTFGWRRDDKRRERAHICGLVDTLAEPRGSADLSELAPAVMDQNEVGACVGHGLAGAIYTSAVPRLPWTPSPRRIYGCALALDRSEIYSTLDAAHLPPLDDRGTMVLTGVDVARTWGLMATEAPLVMPDGSLVNSDCGVANYNRELDMLELQTMARRVVIGPHEITSVGAQRVREICLSLDNGYAVVFGAYVSSVFMDYASDHNPLGLQDLMDANGGGHCMYIIGYHTDASGRVTFRGRNSWGCVWGIAGDFDCTTDFVTQWWEVFVMRVNA